MPHPRIRLAAALLACCLAAPLEAQGLAGHPRVAQALQLLDVWLDAQRDYMELPGLSAAVVHDQQVIWSGAYGFADRERRIAATPGTIYSICSISKLFTSIAVLQQRDAGALRLDDPLARHLPWFRIREVDSLGPAITVEGLLTHASGLPREADHPYWTGPDFAFPTREEVIERLSGQETIYPAETYFQYSNLGLMLAGEVVSATAGESFDAYIRRRILDPLGMASTTTDMPLGQRGRQLARGYSVIQRDGRRGPVTFFQARGLAPAAGFASTALDLARFASWHFRVLARQGGTDVLATNTLREMMRVHWTDPDFSTTWGLGYIVWRDKDETFVGHDGSCPGFRSALLLKPEARVATIFMTNAQGVPADDLAQRMYEIVGPALKDAAADSLPSPPDTTLARYAGSYALGFGGETAILPWKDGLAAVWLPTLNPMESLTRLKRVGEHTFRRVRKDDALGETVTFEMGPDGRPVRFRWHQNDYRRLR